MPLLGSFAAMQMEPRLGPPDWTDEDEDEDIDPDDPDGNLPPDPRDDEPQGHSG